MMTEKTTGTVSPAHSGLSFEQLVPRSLAHRRAMSEVFVADTAQAGDEFLSAIQLPRAHSLWFDRLSPYHDPLSVVEAIRQTMLVIGQRYLRMPADTPATLQHMSFEVEDLSAFLDDEREPLEGIVRIRSDKTQDPADFGLFRDVSFEATVTVSGAQALTLHGSGVILPREAYDEFRELQQAQRDGAESAAPLAPVEPALVGRRDPRNVVIARQGTDLTLLVDRRHPSFFDHPYDHVPGPLLLEGFRQAAQVAAVDAGALDSPVAAVTSAELSFSGFVELGGVITCHTTVRDAGEYGDVEIDVGIEQFGQRLAEGRIGLLPFPDVE